MARSPKKSVPPKTGEITTPGNGYENVYAKAVANLPKTQCSGCSEGNCPIHQPSATEQTTITHAREFDPMIGKATQFQPGVSGNPGGRPKKLPFMVALERIYGDEEALVNDFRDILTSKSAMARVMFHREAFERLGGKVVQPVEADLNLNIGQSERLLRAKERLDGDPSDS